MVSLLIEIFILLGTIIWQIIKGIVMFFIPGSKKDVSNEIVLITGAGSGLGRLMAFRFSALGAVVVCLDINEEANKATVDVIKSKNEQAFAYTCDCSKKDDIYRVAEEVKRDVGDVTILINNAGIVSGKKFMATSDALIQKTFEVNTLAHCWTTKAFLQSMIENNHGHVVSIASSAGYFGVTGLCDYCASKFGAVGFNESLQMELTAMGKNNVHTTVVCPFYINTGMFDGVKTRFPLLLPILDPDYAVDKIMCAVLTNQRMLMIPRVMYILLFLKGLLPQETLLKIGEFCGANAMLDDFKGRNNNKKAN